MKIEVLVTARAALRVHASGSTAVFGIVSPIPPMVIETEDHWFEFRLEYDPRFLKRIARASIRNGKGIPWEDVQPG